MKALLRKDVYTLWAALKSLLLILLLFAAIPSAMQNNFAVLYASILPYTALAYDEHSRWNRLAAMLPYSVRDVVLSKYVLGWGAGGCALALCASVQALLAPFTHRAPQTGLLFLSFCGGVLIVAVTLPLLFRFGVQKGRIMTLLVVGMVCGLAGGLSSIATLSVVYGGERPALWLYAAAAALAALASAVSVPLSMRMYGRREP